MDASFARNTVNVDPTSSNFLYPVDVRLVPLLGEKGLFIGALCPAGALVMQTSQGHLIVCPPRHHMWMWCEPIWTRSMHVCKAKVNIENHKVALWLELCTLWIFLITYLMLMWGCFPCDPPLPPANPPQSELEPVSWKKSTIFLFSQFTEFKLGSD